MISKRDRRKTSMRKECCTRFLEGFIKKFGRKPSDLEWSCFTAGFNMGFKVIRKNINTTGFHGKVKE